MDSQVNAGVKYALLAAVVLPALYLDFVIYQSGETVVAVGFLVLIVLGAYIYTNAKGYAYRYLFPGLLGFFLFVIIPLVFTVYIGFTNYKSSNLLSYERVRDYLKTETYSEGDARYDYQLYPQKDEGVYRVFLARETEEGIGYLSEPFILVQPGVQPRDPIKVEAIEVLPEDEPLAFREVVQRRNNLQTLVFELPDGQLLRVVSLRQFGPQKQLWLPQDDGTFVNQRDGTIITPNFETGFYQNAEGRNVGPGFRVVIGFDNFIRIFTNESISGPFLKIFIWTVVFSSLSVLFTFCVGCFLAVLLEWKELEFRRLYRTLLILPYAVPAFISILIFRGLFNAEFGEINMLLDSLFGIKPDWFTDPTLAKAMILIVNTWLGFPYMMIIVTGILQSVPDTIYEASSIDGAGPLTNFFKLTLPLILPPLIPLLIASFAFNFNNFNLVYLLTAGRPNMIGATAAGETDILVTYTFNLAFRDSGANFGFASAIATILFLIVGILAYINLKLTNRKTRS